MKSKEWQDFGTDRLVRSGIIQFEAIFEIKFLIFPEMQLSIEKKLGFLADKQ